MEKEYQFEVEIVSDCFITAKSEKEARQRIKADWEDKNNLYLIDSEIKLIAVVKTKQNKDGTEDITID